VAFIFSDADQHNDTIILFRKARLTGSDFGVAISFENTAQMITMYVDQTNKTSSSLLYGRKGYISKTGSFKYMITKSTNESNYDTINKVKKNQYSYFMTHVGGGRWEYKNLFKKFLLIGIVDRNRIDHIRLTKIIIDGDVDVDKI
jgi:hypothetical protein